ncbi:MAG: hypothetical protein MPEBLZ_02505 [Candidatus Methanoperedens nitroreducens]|uniref:Uncharacterized protein n=1 Tax=Candidatus Methanoperedens nitratireducens TaxID=1392998 RepID=A0A0P8C808_9EURY|nr:MAG: hypothetical protein MPEBLZ_02505 [Candidatus Methanoperedens sp. BLZ1]
MKPVILITATVVLALLIFSSLVYAVDNSSYDFKFIVN